MGFSTDKMVENITHWANVNSGSYNVLGLERLSALLTKAFSVLECEGDVMSLPPIERVDEMGNNSKIDLGPMLRFWKREKASVQVLLVGHMDTVYGIDHPFQTVTRKSDNTLCGPGVTDMKGGLCVILEALNAFEKMPGAKNLGWELIINPDEEIGSPGSGPFLTDRAAHHHVGLLFEPAMDEKGTLAGVRKGTGNFAINVKGKAAHAGRDFHLGRNAISALAGIVQRIDRLNGERDGVTLHIGLISGGDAINIVPEHAIARIDVRTRIREDEKWIRDHLEAIIAETNKIEGIESSLSGIFTRRPKVLDIKMQKLYDLVLDVAQKLGQHLEIKPSGGCCDGNNLAEAGLPNVDTLGVRGGKIHSSDEYLLIDSLAERAKLTTAILARLNEQGF